MVWFSPRGDSGWPAKSKQDVKNGDRNNASQRTLWEKEGDVKMQGEHKEMLKEAGRLKRLQKLGIALVLIFVCVGCSGSASLSHKDGQGARISNFSEIEEYGANRPPTLYPGSKFIYQDISLSNSQPSKVTMEVKERKEFEHRQAYWIEVTGKGINYFNIYDMDLNWIGLFGDGRELESAEPYLQIFKWPLRIGEKWKSKYTFRDYSDYSRGVQIHTSRVDVNIRTYEEVRVPAGAFKALRIQAGRETFWYAPSIGWVVKEQIRHYGKSGCLLELVDYRIAL